MKKKLSGLDKYVIFCFTVLLIYTVVSQVLFVLTDLEMTTLTTCLYAAFGGECLTCAIIKIFKLRRNDNAAG